MSTYQMVLDALGDDTRRRVFERLQSGSLAVGELCEGLDVSRPAVSQHLRVLLDAGLVDVQQVGTRRYYRVQPQGLDGLRDWLDRFWDHPMDQFVRAAQARAAER